MEKELRLRPSIVLGSHAGKPSALYYIGMVSAERNNKWGKKVMCSPVVSVADGPVHQQNRHEGRQVLRKTLRSIDNTGKETWQRHLHL